MYYFVFWTAYLERHARVEQALSAHIGDKVLLESFPLPEGPAAVFPGGGAKRVGL